MQDKENDKAIKLQEALEYWKNDHNDNSEIVLFNSVEKIFSESQVSDIKDANDEILRLRTQNQALINSDIEQLNEIISLQQRNHNCEMDVEHYKNLASLEFDEHTETKEKADKIWNLLNLAHNRELAMIPSSFEELGEMQKAIVSYNSK